MSHRAFGERFFAALNSGDLQTVGGMLAPDFFVLEPDGLPYAGCYRGLDGWRELAKAVLKTWAGFKIHPLEYLGETTDTLVVRFALSGRSRKTGKTFETTVLELWRFRGPQLCEIRPYYWDTRHLADLDGP